MKTQQVDEEIKKPVSVSLRHRIKRSILLTIFLLAGGITGLLSGLEDHDHTQVQKSWLTLLAAFMVVTWVDRVRIFPGSNRVTRQRGFLIPISGASYQLSDYDRVELREKAKRDGEGNSSYYYPIILAGEKSDTLAKIKSAFAARRAAEKIAQVMQVPLDNRAFGRRSVRSPKLLDTPVAERWAKTGKKFELPELRSDSGVQVKETGERLIVKFPAYSRHRVGGLLMLLIFVAGFALTFTTMGLHIVSGFFAVGSVGVTHMAMKLVGRSKLVFGKGFIRVRNGIAPIKGKMKLRDIEEVIVSDALTLIGDKGALDIILPENKEEAAYVKQLVRREILQRSAG